MTDTALASVVDRLRPLTTGWPDDLLDPTQPIFLARRRADGGASWYAVPRTPRQSREVRDHLLAFIGPSYSGFTGQPADWDAAGLRDRGRAQGLDRGFSQTKREGLNCVDLSNPSISTKNGAQYHITPDALGTCLFGIASLFTEDDRWLHGHRSLEDFVSSTAQTAVPKTSARLTFPATTIAESAWTCTLSRSRPGTTALPLA